MPVLQNNKILASFQISHCVLISEMEVKYSSSENRGHIPILYSRNAWVQKSEKTLLLSNWKERHVVSLHADIIAF